METGKLLIIDGSYGEGGGQILRNSLALSMITGQGIRIENIRANRSNPGLRPQHLAAVRGAASISLAHVEGDGIGSREVLFIPGEVAGGEFSFNIGTAGSVTLLLQCLLPPLLKAGKNSTLRLKGGTDVPWSPPVDYLRFVLLPMLRKMGAEVELTLIERGFYPRGGGEIEVVVHPSDLHPVEIIEAEDDEFLIEGKVFASHLPGHIPSRMKRAAEMELKKTIGKGVTVKIEECLDPGNGTGTGITLWTGGRGKEREEGKEKEREKGEEKEREKGKEKEREKGKESKYVSIRGSSALGKRGVRAEDVGKQAARDLIREIEARSGVDIHAGDQLPVFASLIGCGVKQTCLHYSVREITPHLRTALRVLEQFGHPTATLYEEGFHIML